MHGTFGYRNKVKTKTSVSRRTRIAKMLEGCQSLLQYFKMLFKWHDGGHGSRTPLQDEGETPVMDLVEGCCRPDTKTETRGTCVCAEATIHNSKRTPMQIRRHLHMNRNRQLSMLIVNIETDAQTE